MNGSEIVPDNRENWVNLALLSWAWQKRRFSYRFALILAFVIFVILIFNAKSTWIDLTALLWILFAWEYSTLIKGFHAVLDDSHRSKMLAFLLVKPISRQQLYNHMVLESISPVLLPALAIVLYVLFVFLVGKSFLPGFHSSLTAPALLIVATAGIPLYFGGICMRIYSQTAKGMTIRFLWKVGPYAAWVIFSLGLPQRDPVIPILPWLLTASGPVPIVTALALAAGFYYAGWRLFRQLDLNTDPVVTYEGKRSTARTSAGSGPRRPNQTLLRWFWKRNFRFYLSCLAVSIALLILWDRTQSANPFLIAGLWAGYLGGAGAIWGTDKTVAFLLALPISRRRAFNIQVGGGIIPWLLLGAIPALFAVGATIIKVSKSSPDFTAVPAIFYFIYIIWTLALYLITVYLATSAKANPKKSATNIQAVVWLFLIILASLTTGFWTNRAVMGFVSDLGPLLAGLGLTVGVLTYRAGWRLYQRMDF